MLWSLKSNSFMAAAWIQSHAWRAGIFSAPSKCAGSAVGVTQGMHGVVMATPLRAQTVSAMALAIPFLMRTPVSFDRNVPCA